MHPYLMLAVTVLLFSAQTIFFKAFNTRYMKGLSSYFLFQMLHFGTVTVLLLIINKGLGAVGTLTAITASVWGVLFVAMLLSYMKAMETGPLSLSALFQSSGILIPILWGICFWGERVTFIQIAGLALLLFSYYLGAARSGGTFSPKWFIFVFTSFAINGLLLCVSKQQQLVMQGGQVYEFLIIGFAVAFAVCMFGCLCMYFRRKNQPVTGDTLPLDVSFFVTAGLTGIVTTGGNVFMMVMATRLPSIVQFPVTMGGVVIFTALTSVIYYKEQLNWKSITAIVIGIASLVMLSL